MAQIPPGRFATLWSRHGAACDSWDSERTGRAFSLWQSVQFCWCRGPVSSLGQPGVWAGTVALKENPPGGNWRPHLSSSGSRPSQPLPCAVPLSGRELPRGAARTARGDSRLLERYAYPRRVNRAVFTLCRPLPVCPKQRTSSDRLGMSERGRHEETSFVAPSARKSRLAAASLMLIWQTASLRPQSRSSAL